MHPRICYINLDLVSGFDFDGGASGDLTLTSWLPAKRFSNLASKLRQEISIYHEETIETCLIFIEK